ncbi:uncharacterized protein METZ01_LOCUS486280, partial [marine metagenome]|jgi:DNA polymerase|tara:strand:- start:1946 stop:2521 length:576 start_codon:yes stop_codon:yes gene_type:complete
VSDPSPAPTRLSLLAEEASGCTLCGLAAGRTQVVFADGSPDADLMFVGEGPGAQEDIHGVPFVGRSGKLLDRLLVEEVGIERGDCYIANVVKCRPPGNRDPRPDEITACRPYLEEQVELVDPAVIVTLGNFASKLLLDTGTGITKLRGRSYGYAGRSLVPTFHPAAALRGGSDVLAKLRADLVRAKLLMAR